MSTVLLLIVQLVSLFLRTAKSHDKCPDGICDEPLKTAATLKAQLNAPNVSFSVFDLFGLLRCFPTDRVFAVVQRCFNLLKDCDRCPDGDCSFLDILSCIDIQEAIAIGKEILDIVRDSQVCDGEDGAITLGEAAK